MPQWWRWVLVVVLAAARPHCRRCGRGVFSSRGQTGGERGEGCIHEAVDEMRGEQGLLLSVVVCLPLWVWACL